MLFHCCQTLVEHVAQPAGGHGDVGDVDSTSQGCVFLVVGHSFVVDDEAWAATMDDAEGLKLETADVGQLDFGHEPAATDDVAVVDGEGRIGDGDVWAVRQPLFYYEI